MKCFCFLRYFYFFGFITFFSVGPTLLAMQENFLDNDQVKKDESVYIIVVNPFFDEDDVITQIEDYENDLKEEEKAASVKDKKFISQKKISVFLKQLNKKQKIIKKHKRYRVTPEEIKKDMSGLGYNLVKKRFVIEEAGIADLLEKMDLNSSEEGCDRYLILEIPTKNQ